MLEMKHDGDFYFYLRLIAALLDYLHPHPETGIFSTRRS